MDIINFLKTQKIIQNNNLTDINKIIKIDRISIDKRKNYEDIYIYNKIKTIPNFGENYKRNLNLRDYDCFEISSLNKYRTYLCLKKNTIFYIFTTGLGNSGSTSILNSFIEIIYKFIDYYFKNITILIFNYDNNFNQPIFNEIKEKYISTLNLLSKHNLKIFNFFIDRYINLDNFKIISEKNNYIIFDCAHLLNNIYNQQNVLTKYNSITYGTIDDWPESNFYLNYIYLGYDFIIKQKEYVKDLIPYLFVNDEKYKLKSIYYNLIINSREDWNTLIKNYQGADMTYNILKDISKKFETNIDGLTLLLSEQFNTDSNSRMLGFTLIDLYKNYFKIEDQIVYNEHKHIVEIYEDINKDEDITLKKLADILKKHINDKFKFFCEKLLYYISINIITNEYINSKGDVDYDDFINDIQILATNLNVFDDYELLLPK